MKLIETSFKVLQKLRKSYFSTNDKDDIIDSPLYSKFFLVLSNGT